MKLKYTFVIREVADEIVAISVDSDPDEFGGIVRLKPGVAFLFRLLQEETTAADMTKALMEEYDLESARAAEVVEKFLDRMREQGLLEE